MTNERLQALRQQLADRGLDTLLVSQPENRRYLSGFTGSAGVLIISQNKALLVTDFRYYVQVARQAPDFELIPAPRAIHETLAETLANLGYQRVGFEAHDLTVDTFNQWRQAMPAIEWVETKDLVEGLRQIKSPSELASMRQAIRLADEAMAHIMEWIHPGVTEREVAWELEVHMRTHGAEKLAFGLIVGFGANGAMSHAVPSDRALQRGEPIVIDMGCVYDGYLSDLTRSFCVGEADEQYLAIWNTVLAAQLKVEQTIKPGMTGIEVDAIARDLIYGAGYEGKFGHGLGHSVGLAIHEYPRAGVLAKDPLPAGIVLTVEPGIYLPDWGGVRIEDMIYLQDDGCEVLTQVAKRPVV